MGARSFKVKLGREAGQTLVETAIVLAIFLALGFAVVEFGRAWFYSNHLNNSVRAAARYGAVLGNRFGNYSADPARQKITVYALKEITSYINVPSDERAGMVTVEFSPDRGLMVQRGDTIKVTGSLQFHVLSGDIVGSLGDFRMTRSASMRSE